ncbi:hypothetical protein L2E82_30018 [Cichorium intybus]|uniref:Uncharacterized protein n=1 Tax=Cichorium intybus TaxID=13427 RepID=A0ACB9CZ80_CICIN|nr:hypothetical protein L2E82_30018 [Cichorium intybus]
MLAELRLTATRLGRIEPSVACVAWCQETLFLDFVLRYCMGIVFLGYRCVDRLCDSGSLGRPTVGVERLAHLVVEFHVLGRGGTCQTRQAWGSVGTYRRQASEAVGHHGIGLKWSY